MGGWGGGWGGGVGKACVRTADLQLKHKCWWETAFSVAATHQASCTVHPAVALEAFEVLRRELIRM